jgi:hypothetical protein
LGRGGVDRGEDRVRGSVGDSYDNALAINGLYKAEVIHRRGPWRNFDAVECATREWVDWFNHRRLLEPVGNIPPAEAEDQYDAAANIIDMTACLTSNGLRQSRRGSATAARASSAVDFSARDHQAKGCQSTLSRT